VLGIWFVYLGFDDWELLPQAVSVTIAESDVMNQSVVAFVPNAEAKHRRLAQAPLRRDRENQHSSFDAADFLQRQFLEHE
jgi:hypothetical protein